MTALAERRGLMPTEDGIEMHEIPSAAPDADSPTDVTDETVRHEPGERHAPLLREFQAAIDVRVDRERRLAAEQADEQDERERELRAQMEARDAALQADTAKLDFEYEERRGAVVSESDTVESAARDEHLSRVREIEAEYYRETAEVESRHQNSTWVTSSVLDDSADDSPLRQFERASQSRERTRDFQVVELDAVQTAFDAATSERGWRVRELPATEVQPRSLDEAQEAFSLQIAEARTSLETVAALRIPRLFMGYSWLIIGAAICGALFAPLFLFVPPTLIGVDPGLWGPASAGIAAIVAVLILLVTYTIGAMRQSELFLHAQQALDTANRLHQAWRELAARVHQKQHQEFESRQAAFEKQRAQALGRYQRALEERRTELEKNRSTALQVENSRYGELQQALQSARLERTTHIDAEHSQRRSALTAAGEAERSRLLAELDEHVQRRRRRQAELWHQLKTEWDAATRRFEAGVQQAQADSRAHFADWSTLAGGGWTPPAELPTGIRRGEYRIDLERWPHAIPVDMRLAPRATQIVLPSVTEFPSSASLYVRTSTAESREVATQLLQSELLRWLTLVPPGKLRLTIIDPVGLGESFAGFMHLADFDELLVTKRIWTEPDHIEQQLADLTQHMENVLQKYLRNEFATIEEYNTFAGEVAEPYRLLVITDFPAKFSELAARRLTSIISSGPRCGVFTLLSMDPRRDLPHGFDPSLLDEKLPALRWTRTGERKATINDLLDADGARPADQPSLESAFEPGFRIDSGPLSNWPLTVDAPPSPEQFTSIVRSVGDASKDARRIEVSFDRIAPASDRLWTESSRSGIDIPLGRAGATKHQHLKLGKGTSQHMLIAGKTGSGKSTFLHCLITNLALYYSPDEVRFSLVDFKKGVEFKDYAAFNLPHADVIAIESDREFGVSVLQRLDAVLQERGDKFRRAGVQDLPGYRAARPDEPLPRLLLVIDEFQEFFVEEDRLSQTAALLLDRLIRQGRAFGMHVVLGSQTLGGAYSLARSTMGQVAVRVALQCSEADAHLILSEENTAARLLTRPGEAIYNDANGLVEGNHPFQIAWLPDDQRETWLRRMQALAAQQGRNDPPAIVFEGNIPSDPARNLPLLQLLRERTTGVVTTDKTDSTAPVWLGEAVEIKPPTALTFERRNGANVVLVGQDSEAALGILTTAAMTIAARSGGSPGGLAPVTVLDGSQPDSVDAAAWQALAKQFPAEIRVLGARASGDVLRELSDELQRRNAEPDVAHPARFLVVYHLSRFRDLRKSDDEFGFSSFGSGDAEKPVDPSKLFADLLASGPVVGLHVLVWCDSANTVERWFSRTAMRELENRIVFQMNSSDSSNLIDSPAAARLGPHRALLYREESGTSEKFRPYHAPEPGWLQSLAAGTSQTAATAPPAGTAEPADDGMSVAKELSEFRIL